MKRSFCKQGTVEEMIVRPETEAAPPSIPDSAAESPEQPGVPVFLLGRVLFAGCIVLLAAGLHLSVLNAKFKRSEMRRRVRERRGSGGDAERAQHAQHATGTDWDFYVLAVE